MRLSAERLSCFPSACEDFMDDPLDGGLVPTAGAFGRGGFPVPFASPQMFSEDLDLDGELERRSSLLSTSSKDPLLHEPNRFLREGILNGNWKPKNLLSDRSVLSCFVG